mgnify:CR=1 FL=1
MNAEFIAMLEYLEKEKALLTEGAGLPDVRADLHHRHVMVVVRGYDYKEDLATLSPYIREMKPVLVGVDGGADAIAEAGFTPDVIASHSFGEFPSLVAAGALSFAAGAAAAAARARRSAGGTSSVSWPPCSSAASRSAGDRPSIWSTSGFCIISRNCRA